MPTINENLRNKAAADFLSNQLSGLVASCQAQVDSLVHDLRAGMAVDKVKRERIDFAQNAVVDIVIAASYSLPGGSTIQHILKLMRSRSLSDAWWLSRNGGSEFAKMHGITNNVHAKSDLLDAEGRTVGKQDADFVNVAWANTGTQNQDDALQQAEGDVVGTLSGRSSGFPSGGSATISPALQRLSASVKPVNDDSEFVETYKRIIAQLVEVRDGGRGGLLPYALAALVENITVNSNGVSIVELGGFVCQRDGRSRFALGPAEVKRAREEDQTLNRVQLGWRHRAWYHEPAILEAQERIDPVAYKVYEEKLGWSTDETDAILLFKAQITAYREKLEDQIATGTDIGNVVKKIIADIDSEDIAKRGFKEQGTGWKILTGRNGIFRGFVRTISFGQAWKATKNAKERAEVMMDCYIFYKILEFHLGTPWIAAIPNNETHRAKVLGALSDAYITIVMSKAVGPKHHQGLLSREHGWKRGGSGHTNLAHLLPTWEILDSPTTAAFWSPLPNYIAACDGGLAEKAEDQSGNEDQRWQKAVREASNKLTDTKLSDKGPLLGRRDYMRTIPVFSKEGVRQGIEKYAIRYGDGHMTEHLTRMLAAFSKPPQESLQSLTTAIESLNKKIQQIFAPQDQGSNAEQGLKAYVASLKLRRQLDQVDTSNLDIDALVQRPQFSPSGRLEKTADAFAAQDIAMNLLAAGQEDPTMVLKLMHETIAELIASQMPTNQLNPRARPWYPKKE